MTEAEPPIWGRGRGWSVGVAGTRDPAGTSLGATSIRGMGAIRSAAGAAGGWMDAAGGAVTGGAAWRGEGGVGDAGVGDAGVGGVGAAGACLGAGDEAAG